jgi:hypothetical protein
MSRRLTSSISWASCPVLPISADSPTRS